MLNRTVPQLKTLVAVIFFIFFYFWIIVQDQIFTESIMMLILALTCQHVFLRFHSKCQLQRFCHLLRRTDSPWIANGNQKARVEVWQQLKWMLCLHAYIIFPVTVLTCPCHLRWKSPPLCVLPGRQCHSTMYKHEKAHQGNWGFNNQRLGARRDQWFQMEVQGQREGGRRRGEQSQRCLHSQRHSEWVKNAPGVCSSWPDISCPPAPFQTRVTCCSSDHCATLQPVP